MKHHKKFILIILDGYGLNKNTEANAAALANTPVLDRLKSDGSMVSLETSGKFVGLPDGVMGNSEVGHTNIGAGRVVKQDLVRINDTIKSNGLTNNPSLNSLFDHVKNNNSTLHFMGLLSDAGVHSHIDHLKELLRLAKNADVPDTAIHPITDGRDTSPTSGVSYMKELLRYLNELQYGSISTVCGRYYTMDRDTRWDRTETAYRMLTNCIGEKYSEPVEAVLDSYEKNITDEFIKPKIIGDCQPVQSGDALFLFNFRADRMRQIVSAFMPNPFEYFITDEIDVNLVSMTQYREDFAFPVLFPPINLKNIFPGILAKAGYRQLRIAETEKYAHVTYFMNGGEEKIFPNEKRILIPSPRVKTYDLQPEMSAAEVTDKVVDAVRNEEFEAIFLNFANPDMVGHTGILSAAVSAIQTVDSCLGEIISSLQDHGWALFLTADHGNLEMMTDPMTGNPHTAHTTFPVPFVLLEHSGSYSLTKNGKLADIAPTILDYLGLPVPPEMDGVSLLNISL